MSEPQIGEGSGLDALAALVRDCAASGVGRRVLLLRTDLLPPGLRRPHHLRLARAALDPLILADRGRRHELARGRLAVSWRGESAGPLRQALETLETLLKDSPLDAPSVAELAGTFDLPRDGSALLEEALVAAPAPEPQEAPPPPRPPDPPPAPLDPAGLGRIEQRLAGADMARFARRRPVCRLGPSGMQPAWEQRFLSVAELIETVAPGRDALAEPWLFLRLTRVLDRGMLALLCSPDELRAAGAFGLSLNVASVLGPEFLRFDAALPPALRGQVVIDLLPTDLLADPASFAFARNFTRARCYKLGLAGLSLALLPMLNLDRLEVDFVSLRWRPELARCGRTLPDAGGARWILTGADGEEAVAWGREAGIGLFTGRAAG